MVKYRKLNVQEGKGIEFQEKEIAIKEMLQLSRNEKNVKQKFGAIAFGRVQSRKLTDEQENELMNVISTQTPEQAGIEIFANWTAVLACEWAKLHFHEKFSESAVYEMCFTELV